MAKRMRASLVALLFSSAIVFAEATPPAEGGREAPLAGKAPAARDFYAAGYKASRAGQYSKAIEAFRAAIAIDPAYAEAYNMLGFDLRKVGEVDEAIKNYTAALRLKPDFPEAREYLGEAYLMTGNVKDAVRQYIILQAARRPQARELLEKIDSFLKSDRGA